MAVEFQPSLCHATCTQLSGGLGKRRATATTLERLATMRRDCRKPKKSGKQLDGPPGGQRQGRTVWGNKRPGNAGSKAHFCFSSIADEVEYTLDKVAVRNYAIVVENIYDYVPRVRPFDECYPASFERDIDECAEVVLAQEEVTHCSIEVLDLPDYLVISISPILPILSRLSDLVFGCVLRNCLILFAL